MLEPVVPDFGAAFDLASAPAVDLAFTPAPDLALTVPVLDLGGNCGGTQSCTSDEICIFVNRGDCSTYACVKPPAQCAGKLSCACLGTSLCPTNWGNEVFECIMPAPELGALLECRSSIQCV